MKDSTTPHERPILFSGPMVRAILAGTKTVTRRLAWDVASGAEAGARPYWPGVKHGGDFVRPEHCPYGVAGDRLWVRETWCDADVMYGEGGNECASVVGYAADKSAIQYDAPKPRKIPAYDIAQWNWSKLKMRPSTSLPRWASRITLEIVSVRVERLQDITDTDITAEGAVDRMHRHADLGDMPVSTLDGKAYMSRRDLWAAGWDMINGKRAPWASNPWVWVVTFRRL